MINLGTKIIEQKEERFIVYNKEEDNSGMIVNFYVEGPIKEGYYLVVKESVFTKNIHLSLEARDSKMILNRLLLQDDKKDEELRKEAIKQAYSRALEYAKNHSKDNLYENRTKFKL